MCEVSVAQAGLNIAASGSTRVTRPCESWNPRGTFIHAFAVTMKNADAAEGSAIGIPDSPVHARGEPADASHFVVLQSMGGVDALVLCQLQKRTGNLLRPVGDSPGLCTTVCRRSRRSICDGSTPGSATGLVPR